MRHSIQRVKAIKKQIGQNIKIARERCDLTQKELAGFIGVTEKRMGEIEAGTSSLTHFNMVICAHRLETPIETLYGEIPKRLLEEIQSEAQRKHAQVQSGFSHRRGRPTVDVNLNGIQIKLDL